MRNGICPKCGHDDVRVGKEGFTRLGQAGAVFGMQAIVSNIQVAYDVYICLYCGYAELAVSDGAVLQEIGQKWPRVGGPPAG